MMNASEGVETPAKAPVKPRKRFVGTSARPSSSKTAPRRIANQIPDDILHDPELQDAIKGDQSVSEVRNSSNELLRQACPVIITLRFTRLSGTYGGMG